MDKKNRLLLPLTILGTAVIFLILINHQKSYPSLKAAVRTTSAGGEVTEKMKCKDGYYVFIGDSSIITSGFYYEKNNKWYYDSHIRKRNYQINDNIELSVYYIFKESTSILEITQKDPVDLTISDSYNTVFKGRKNDSKQYLAVINHNLNSDYKITINEKEYKPIKK